MNGIINHLVYAFLRLACGCKHLFTNPRRWSVISPYIVYNYLRYHGVDVTFGTVRMVGFPIVLKARRSRISLGHDVTLISHSRGNPAGINHPVILATLREGAVITIGNGCGFSGASLCSATSITIGDHTGFGANASAYDTDFHSVDHFGTPLDGLHVAKSKPILVGNYVWVGANAMILKGVQIGDHSVIPAGTIVRDSTQINSSISRQNP